MSLGVITYFEVCTNLRVELSRPDTKKRANPVDFGHAAGNTRKGGDAVGGEGGTRRLQTSVG